jgi:hypothetical protein
VKLRDDCYEIVQASLFHLEHEVDVIPRELGALAVASQLESRAGDFLRLVLKERDQEINCIARQPTSSDHELETKPKPFSLPFFIIRVWILFSSKPGRVIPVDPTHPTKSS